MTADVIRRLVDQGVPTEQVAGFLELLNEGGGTATPGRTDGPGSGSMSPSRGRRSKRPR